LKRLIPISIAPVTRLKPGVNERKAYFDRGLVHLLQSDLASERQTHFLPRRDTDLMPLRRKVVKVCAAAGLCVVIIFPFRFLTSLRKTYSLQQFLKARVVAQRFHEGIDFHEANKLVGFVDCLVKCGKGSIPISYFCIKTCHVVS
jgi:hypothetical protein